LVSVAQRQDRGTGVQERGDDMNRLTRIVLLITALTSLLAAMSSTAGAVTWTNTGNTAVHATGVGGGLHLGGNTFSCTGATATGTAPADVTGAVYSVTGTLTFSPCSLVGQSTTIHCNYTLTGVTHTGGALGGVTGIVADVTCDIRLTVGIGLCHISGSTPGHYVNPAAAGGTGRLTLTTSTTLVVSNFGSTNCPLGTGPGTLTHQALTTTVGATPIINRDA
jgi:hypothetical protein